MLFLLFQTKASIYIVYNLVITPWKITETGCYIIT
jgi:hypothetical protein